MKLSALAIGDSFCAVVDGERFCGRVTHISGSEALCTSGSLPMQKRLSLDTEIEVAACDAYSFGCPAYMCECCAGGGDMRVIS